MVKQQQKDNCEDKNSYRQYTYFDSRNFFRGLKCYKGGEGLEGYYVRRAWSR